VARLDRLIQVLYEQRADSLRLAVGKPATLVGSGATRALTRDPLTDAQILALVREVADAESAPRLGGPAPLSFPYRSPSGQVTVELTPGADGPVVEVRANGAGSRAPAAVAPGASELAEARAAIEDLFRLLVDAGASDLHLRTGEPPLLRLHGELVRDERPAVGAERLETMLTSIMTPREVAEFRDTGDTDWAYEIAGIARFRCNAGRDRHGPIGVFRVIPTTASGARPAARSSRTPVSPADLLSFRPSRSTIRGWWKKAGGACRPRSRASATCRPVESARSSPRMTSVTP